MRRCKFVCTSHAMCSAVRSFRRKRCENEFVLRQIGHFVISSGHSYGATDAGASQYFGSRPHTEPEIRPPGPGSPGDHFFHVEIDFYERLKVLHIENWLRLHDDLTVGHRPRTEQSACELCTHPESSFRIQQAVSRSCRRAFAIESQIFVSRRMQAANFAPKCTRSSPRGPIHTLRGS